MSALQKQATEMYADAKGFLKSVQSVKEGKSKFNADLLYNISVMCLEKLYMTYLSQKKVVAIHHTPMSLLNDAKSVEPFPENIIAVTKLISRFESICSLDGFGYKTPSNEEIITIVNGLFELNDFILDRLGEEFIQSLPKELQPVVA